MSLEEYKKYLEEMKKGKNLLPENQKQNEINESSSEKQGDMVPEYPENEKFLHEGIPPAPGN
jgi:DNA-directed RNA polymerase subunit H (RpoH/RPB5)